jgi:hypothetical protein
VLAKARAQSVRVGQSSALRTIEVTLVVYHNDNRGYLPVWGPDKGAKALYAALALPRPGKLDLDPDGTGKPTRSSVALEPYLKGDSVKADKEAGVFLDAWGKPILYYSALKNPPVINRPAGEGNGYVPRYATAYRYSATYDQRESGYKTNGFAPPLYNVNDNVTAVARDVFQPMLGDFDRSGDINNGETGIVKPFLLWSAGADGVYGPTTGTARADVEKADDVTNFR